MPDVIATCGKFEKLSHIVKGITGVAVDCMIRRIKAYFPRKADPPLTRRVTVERDVHEIIDFSGR